MAREIPVESFIREQARTVLPSHFALLFIRYCPRNITEVGSVSIEYVGRGIVSSWKKEEKRRETGECTIRRALNEITSHLSEDLRGFLGEGQAKITRLAGRANERQSWLLVPV